MEMGGSEQIYQDKAIKENDGNDARHDQWVIMKGGNEISDSSSIESSFGDSTSSILSSSSSDMIEDATSPISSSLPSYGAAYDLSELMANLPIKRGLSKYYEGKSESFASLACVKSIEDLAKKGRPCGRKMKPWKGCYGGGLDNQIYSPKATISKKTLSSLGRRGATLFSSCRPPIPLQKNL